jgi:chromosome segregation ATPase
MSDSKPRGAAQPIHLSPDRSLETYQRLTSQVDSLRASVANASRVEWKFRQRVSDLEAENSDLLSQLSTLQRVKLDLAQSLATNSQLSADFDASTRANAALEQKLMERTAQLKDTRLTLQSIATKYEKLIGERQSQDRKMIELMELQIRSNEQRSALQRRLEQHLETAESLKQRVRTSRQRLRAAEKRADELAVENQELRRDIEELGGENEELVAIVAEAQEELTKSRLASQIQEIDNGAISPPDEPRRSEEEEEEESAPEEGEIVDADSADEEE